MTPSSTRPTLACYATKQQALDLAVQYGRVGWERVPTEWKGDADFLGSVVDAINEYMERRGFNDERTLNKIEHEVASKSTSDHAVINDHPRISKTHAAKAQQTNPQTKDKGTGRPNIAKSGRTPWQNDNHMGQRREVIQEILRLLRHRLGSCPCRDISSMAAQVEVLLYRKAKSLSSYVDLSTLPERLQSVAEEVARSRAIPTARIETRDPPEQVSFSFAHPKVKGHRIVSMRDINPYFH